MSNNNKIKFKHFVGSLNRWTAKINSNVWDNAVVFGRVYDYDNGKWLYKIYAGIIAESDNKTLYEYNIPDEKRIVAIENTLKTDDNLFINEDFKTALQNTINLLFTKNNNNLEKRIELVESAVVWNIKEENTNN